MSSKRKLKRKLKKNPEIVKRINDSRIQSETDRLIRDMIVKSKEEPSVVAASNVALD